MKSYDFIFAGGGLSGTMLLYLFLQTPLRNKKFLLIDKQLRRRYSRQWSYWMNQKTPFDHLVTKQWKAFSVYVGQINKEFPLNDYTISLLESEKYFSFVDSYCKGISNVKYLEDMVVNINDANDHAVVTTANDQYYAKYVFDSTVSYDSIRKTNGLTMTGLGVSLQTSDKVFDPSFMTFMDFRGSCENDLMFLYVMPITRSFAYIDVAHVTNAATSDLPRKHEEYIKSYIGKYLQNTNYTIHRKKFEEIGLMDNDVRRLAGKHVLQIGAKAGLIKATTSYGFVNIYNDSKMIVESFVKSGKPKFIKTKNQLHHTIDSAMLDLMHQCPEDVKNMYYQMFAKQNSGDKILAYLNEELSVLDSLKVITKVDPRPMAKIFQKRITNG